MRLRGLRLSLSAGPENWYWTWRRRSRGRNLTCCQQLAKKGDLQLCDSSHQRSKSFKDCFFFFSSSSLPAHLSGCASSRPLTRQCEISYLGFISPRWKPALCSGTNKTFHLTRRVYTHPQHQGAKVMEGHCWFALRVGNAAWHTVNSTVRETRGRWKERKRRRLNWLSAAAFEDSYLWHSEPVKFFFIYLLRVLCEYFDQAANFSIGRESGTGHALPRRRQSFACSVKEAAHSPHFCYLNGLMFQTIVFKKRGSILPIQTQT